MASRELVFRRCAQHDEAADGHHHGSANALQYARQRELGQRVGRAAEQRCEGKRCDGRGENRTRAEAVCNPTADRDKDGQGEQVGRHADVEANGATGSCAPSAEAQWR